MIRLVIAVLIALFAFAAPAELLGRILVALLTIDIASSLRWASRAEAQRKAELQAARDAQDEAFREMGGREPGI